MWCSELQQLIIVRITFHKLYENREDRCFLTLQFLTETKCYLCQKFGTRENLLAEM